MSLFQTLNALSEDALHEMLHRCCGSQKWVQKMISERPFLSDEALFVKAKDIWTSLEKEDFLEAFSHHPKIGGNLDQLRKKFKPTKTWSQQEQAQVAEASEATLRALSKGNIDYENRFGYIFIVCATGKSAGEMLALLQERIHNPPTKELRIAAEEQAKITQIRMEKWTL